MKKIFENKLEIPLLLVVLCNWKLNCILLSITLLLFLVLDVSMIVCLHIHKHMYTNKFTKSLNIFISIA